jgi:hypothetical protein
MSGEIKNTKSRPKWVTPIAVVAVIFGFTTIISGGKSLFTEAGGLAAGNYVPFVLWFNFVAGFAYVIAGVGIAQGRLWSKRLAILIAATTCLVFIFFGFHIAMGGVYENRTLMAMVLRSGFWLAVARLSYFSF